MINLIHGDALEEVKKMQDKSIDLVITDPPYRYENKGGGFYAKNNSTKRYYLDDLMSINCCDFNPIDLLTILKSKMKKFYGYFFCNKTLVSDYINFAKSNNYHFDILVMAKSNPIPSFNNHHLSDLEYIILIREKGTYFSKHKNLDDFRKFYITSCKKGIHPSEKPIDLIKRYIRVSSKIDDLIIDPFMGSGTTGEACKELNRNFIGIEIDKKYYEIAKERIGK